MKLVRLCLLLGEALALVRYNDAVALWTCLAVRRAFGCVRFGRRLTVDLELVRTRGIRLSN